ncbi:hypothetical protein [Butyrivibrio sp. XPD2002]|uniref:hypothetical protein n=1 Tax=Butyrivibrio sp. XPD2002 TaxID=1280665 RepID=UPI0004159144|nr:hypothetical protein [Butyrivibrio sp. XPD2002]
MLPKVPSFYHYDVDCINRGLEEEYVKVEKWFEGVMRAMQDKMLEIIADKGISIECNPSSNVLIGPFNEYCEHPITRFNNYILEDNENNPEVKVSINTDDLGVFDTSLENEYALMYEAIYEMRKDQGKKSRARVYEYLKYIKDMGYEISFK